MIKKIKSYLLIIASTLIVAVPAAMPAATTYAVSGGCKSNIAGKVAEGANDATNADGANGLISCSETNVNDNAVGGLANSIVNLFSIIVGAVSIIMIIYGGFRYITSGGDSGKVGNAKNTLIYAIVGLIIVALAQVIVHFVLAKTNTAQL